MATTTTIDMRIKKAYIGIHKAIHNKEVTSVILIGKHYPVRTGSNGCRWIDYDGFVFMEQNKKSRSKYAQAAIDGAHITWGIKAKDTWIYLDDNIVEAFEKKEAKALASIGIKS